MSGRACLGSMEALLLPLFPDFTPALTNGNGGMLAACISRYCQNIGGNLGLGPVCPLGLSVHSFLETCLALLQGSLCVDSLPDQLGFGDTRP